jgi:hypothetical protein
MPRKQHNKTRLVLEIDNGRQARELEVPTDRGADDEGLYREIDEFVVRNTKYDSINQLLNVSGPQELNLHIENQNGITYRGMTVTQVKYPQ